MFAGRGRVLWEMEFPSIVGGSRTYLGGAMTSRCVSGRLNYFPLAAPRTSPLVGIRVCSFAQLALGCSNPSQKNTAMYAYCG